MLGQAKMTIYATRKRKMEQNNKIDVLVFFKCIIRARICLEFNYHRLMDNVEGFKEIWSLNGKLCTVIGKKLSFSENFL